MALYVKYDCATCENKNCTGHGLPTTEKVCDGYKHTVTNADKLRAMSDEELAEFIAYSTSCETCAVRKSGSDECHNSNCSMAWLDWLRQEASE